MQHFIGGGKISKESIIDFYKGSTKEANLRSHMVALQSKYGKQYAPNLNDLAHDLWESNKDFTPYAEVTDYKNDLEEVIQEYTSVVQMAKDLIKTYTLEEQVPNEEIISDMNQEAEKNDVAEEVGAISDALESETDETISKLADDQQAFDKWEEDSDIKYFDGDVPFQKESQVKGDFNKAIEVLQKAMPKMKVVYDKNLEVAGYVYKDTVFVNPNYAGLDTPIHEYGHVLIDALGYNSELVQEGIKQLKSSPLWAETEARYSELTEEQLGKEVLAEAIGREGADIFEDVNKESKFKKWLDKIFTWFKEKLGLEKNVAKKLAKQLLRGESTQEMSGTSTEVQKQKVKEQALELKDKTVGELAEMYNELTAEGKSSKLLTAVKLQLGYKLFVERKNELLNSKNAEKFVEQLANKEDIGKKDVLFRALSHMAEYVPELQKFSKQFDSAYFDMTEESYKLKSELEKLGKAVIEEKNKKLGFVKGKLAGMFSSDNTKYFEYLENPKAIEEIDEDTGEKTYSAGYWTEEQAKAKGFTDTQIKFLNFMRKMQELRNEQYENSGNTGTIDEILKVDKGFKETFKTEGLLQAFSAYLGNSYALKESDVTFTDPITGKRSIMKYGDVERKLYEYGKRGALQKLNAIRLMLKYNFQARKGAKDKGGQYNLSPTGVLNNKFLKPRDKNRGYSKDFYKAALSFIDDYSHTKHIGQLLPYIDAIETLNELGFEEHGRKERVVEWVKDWKDMHLFKNEKQGKLGPEVDAGLRFLRGLTSQLVMAFNIPASLMNVWMGQYNNWRAEGGNKWKEGQKRLFGKKGIDEKAKLLIKKYQVVSQDYESNPKQFAGKLFDNLAFGLTRMGEYYIQGSMFLGLMTDADYNSFEVKDGELVVKEGVDEKALKEKMIAYKNRVSDIQGKYSEKDRRNFMNSEFGKSMSQFKVWVPDFLEERFRKEYINENGDLKKGSYREFTISAINELRGQIKQDGAKAIWNNKAAMSNLRGALFLAGLYTLSVAGSDDEKKRRKGDLVAQMMSNVLFIFDPKSLKFTIERPLASIGTLTKFVDALDYALAFEDDDFLKGKGRFGDKGDSKLWGSLAQLAPYHKILINDLTFPK